MSEQDKAGQKAGLKSWFSCNDVKADNSANESTPAEQQTDSSWLDNPVYFEEGNLDVTLPSLPAVDVPIIENPRSEALAQAEAPDVVAQPVADNSFFGRMKVGLTRTREQFANGMVTLLIGGKEIDDELLGKIETIQKEIMYTMG